jgi:hypothetical protein
MAIDLAAKHSCVVKGGSLDEMHFRVVASSLRENGAARCRGAEAFIVADELLLGCTIP